MKLPTPDQYNEAVQLPRVAFADADLKQGNVETTSLGIPWGLGGGFAITYRVNCPGRRAYAVRCFHRHAADLHERYQQVHRALVAAAMPYFVEFQYQGLGIRVNGAPYPIVKMEWVSGQTLGDYVSECVRDQGRLVRLLEQWRALASQLPAKGIAHGDLQNGNVLVSPNGLVLVDYDGMFVPGLRGREASELGHRNFQHPRRTLRHFDVTLDRFSFIAVHVSLVAVQKRPELYCKYCNNENIIFSAQDYLDLSGSAAFAECRRIADTGFQAQLDAFARVCVAPFEQTPTLEDFLAGRSIPTRAAVSQPMAPPTSYQGANPVVDASSTRQVAVLDGSPVELVGRVVNVHMTGEYAFVDFGEWRSRDSIRLYVPGLVLDRVPGMRLRVASWDGKWVSAQGLLVSYYDKRSNRRVPQVKIDSPQQVQIISEKDVAFRLGKTPTSRSASASSADRNRAVLDSIGQVSEGTPLSSAPRRPSSTPVPSAAAPIQDRNRTILQGMGATSSSAKGSSRASSAPTQTGTASRGSSSPTPGGCLVLLASLVGLSGFVFLLVF